MKCPSHCVIISFTVCATILVGCTTTAQQKADQIKKQLATVTRSGSDCMERVNNSNVGKKLDEILIIRGPGNVQNKFKKVRIDRKIGDRELKLLDRYMRKGGKCRKQILEGLSQAHPAFVKVMTNHYSKLDSIVVDLARKDIMIGNANEQILQSYQELQNNLETARRRVNRQLRQLQENEIKRRQAAIQALQQWSYQQRKLKNQQQILNELRQPTYTDCQYFGNQLSCSTY